MMAWPYSLRLSLAAFLCVAYLGFALKIIFRQVKLGREQKHLKALAPSKPQWIVAFASQTGSAAHLASQTAEIVRMNGTAVWFGCLDELTLPMLEDSERALFVLSTYGEGDSPDNAARFVARCMQASVSLNHMHCAVLALGDSSYRNYCGFGLAFSGWLQASGAHFLHPLIKVDCDNQNAINLWRSQVVHWSGTRNAPDWQAPAFEQWTLSKRTLLNSGSAGQPVYQLEFIPEKNRQNSLVWQSGDLVQILPPGATENTAAKARDYSIASVMREGCVRLMVRVHQLPDGGTGMVSGWLGNDLQPGQKSLMRIRAHPGFRLDGNADQPLILIGNGTGLAGLRAHLKAREHNPHTRNWLVFGERNRASDFYCRDELTHWRTTGVLERLDLAFSRDTARRVYVQHVLLEQAAMVRQWVGQGAAIYVCGSLNGMAGGVHKALQTILGNAVLDQLAENGRYRRDVY
ncbi:MAG TPA: sulfite reductase subunit alpha [Limnobacter sp.]|uniref:sulfite reductase subunit alpha n=1 Tax=Limnobacter sp. TaxID=2003368 RepID=UPI002E3025CD|nr:sulfite reductase subunit alpha [Limnobacter sp.]HEX5484805.1 sulfite reductase subunit alpha [Limnobacter sp.]